MVQKKNRLDKCLYHNSEWYLTAPNFLLASWLKWHEFRPVSFTMPFSKLFILTKLMPRLHLPRSLYDLFVYDFPYDFFDIVRGYKLRRICLHCLRSPYDFFWRQTKTKPYRDLADFVRQPQSYSYNHRVIFTTSLYKSHDAGRVTLRKLQGVAGCAIIVWLSATIMHWFKRPSMIIFGFHLNCVFKVMWLLYGQQHLK